MEDSCESIKCYTQGKWVATGMLTVLILIFWIIFKEVGEWNDDNQ